MRITTATCLFTLFVVPTAYLQYAIRFDKNDGLQKIAQLKKNITEEKYKNAELIAENERSRFNLRELEESPDYYSEVLARKWLFMIKPDEVYVAEPKAGSPNS